MTRRRFETDDPTAVREPGVEPQAGVLPNLDDEPGPARRLSSARTARMVDDILAARDKLKATGARVLGDGEPKIGAHGKPVLFLHPKDFTGTLVELEQA